MGLCQSSALKVIVFTSEGQKQEYHFAMKKMRTFKTLGDVLNSVGVDLSPTDRIYYQNHVKMVELYTYSPFQIRDLVVKPSSRDVKYRIVMDGMY